MCDVIQKYMFMLDWVNIYSLSLNLSCLVNVQDTWGQMVAGEISTCVSHLLSSWLTRDFRSCQSFAIFSADSHVLSYHVSLGHPMLLLPCGIHIKAVHCNDSSIILIMWPILFHFLSITVDSDIMSVSLLREVITLWYLARTLLCLTQTLSLEGVKVYMPLFSPPYSKTLKTVLLNILHFWFSSLSFQTSRYD